MKKLALLLLVAFQAINLQAQQTINFKIGYKPNTTYKHTADQKMKNSISYGADMEPMEQEVSSKLTNTMKTGKLSGGTIPVTVFVEAEKGSDAAAVMPNGANIYGSIQQDGAPKFDSINAPGMAAEVKTMILGMMQSMASQNLVPARNVKVGETFVIDTPMDMPMGPMMMHTKTKTTYKLNKVEGRKAYLDFTQVIDMQTNIQGQDMKGSGTGAGSMVYDIDNNYFLDLNSMSTMTMNMEAQGMKMTIAIAQDSKNHTDISAN